MKHLVPSFCVVLISFSAFGGGTHDGESVRTRDGKFKLIDIVDINEGSPSRIADYTKKTPLQLGNETEVRKCIQDISKNGRFIGKMIERAFPHENNDHIPEIVFAATWCTQELAGDWLSLDQFQKLSKTDQVALELHWTIFQQGLNLLEARKEVMQKMNDR